MVMILMMMMMVMMMDDDGDDHSDGGKDCVQHVNIAMANPGHLEPTPLVRKME